MNKYAEHIQLWRNNLESEKPDSLVRGGMKKIVSEKLFLI